MEGQKAAGEPDHEELFGRGYERLRSGEYPESVARDLRKQGVTDSELRALFAGTAAKQRRSGYLRTIFGVAVSLMTALIVVAAEDAGIGIYGPGLAIGLVILANGVLKLRNARDIARAVPIPSDGRRQQ